LYLYFVVIFRHRREYLFIKNNIPVFNTEGWTCCDMKWIWAGPVNKHLLWEGIFQLQMINIGIYNKD